MQHLGFRTALLTLHEKAARVFGLLPRDRYYNKKIAQEQRLTPRNPTSEVM